MPIYLCASGEFIMFGRFLRYCLRVPPFRTGLKACFPGFLKADDSGVFKGEVSLL